MPEGQEEGATNIVVTRFCPSLANAIAIKKEGPSVVDTLLAEDIGKFPQTNLAESMQRVPGVAIARSDDECFGRRPWRHFTRVRLNGMEGTGQTSGSLPGAGRTAAA